LVLGPWRSAQIAPIGGVADERLVAFLQLRIEGADDLLPILAVLLGLRLIAADDVALAVDLDLLDEELRLAGLALDVERREGGGVALEHHLPHDGVGALSGAEDVVEPARLQPLDSGRQDHLVEIWPVVFGVAALAERLAALAVKRERGRVHEHGGEIAEQIAPFLEQPLLDRILDAARRERVIGLLLHLLAEPSHGAIEMMQIEPRRAGDVVVLHPRRAVAIGARDEEAMQRRNEHGALNGKLEGAVSEQIAENLRDAQPLPDFAKQQRAAEALGRGRHRAALVLIEGGDQHHLVGELGARGEQRGERAGGFELVGAAERGDDTLAHGALDALVLDDLHVSAFAGLLEAEEHGGPRKTEHHRIRFYLRRKAYFIGIRGTTFLKNFASKYAISIAYRRMNRVHCLSRVSAT